MFVVAGVMLAALLQTVDATIVNVALPNIQGNLGATVDEATWVVTAYVIANVVVIPLTPWLQMRLGRRTYFLTSIIGFTGASMLCGMATSLDMLIFFRVIQGAFGGGLLPLAQVVLRETFPPEQLGTSQSLFTMGAILGPSIGPTLGGVITDSLSWQWVFDINLLPGIASAVLLALFLRGNAPKRSNVDVAGIALLIAAIGSLQYVLDQGQHEDWFSSPTICLFSVTALIGGAAFVWWELRTSQPIVDLRILRSRAVAAASLLGATVAVPIYGGLLLLPQFSVEQLGFTATLAGVLIGCRAVPVAVLNFPVASIVNRGRVDLRLLVFGGLVVASFGSLWIALRITTDATVTSLALPLMVLGTGIAFVFSPLLVCAVRAVPAQDGPKAAAFVTLATQLGGSIAIASLVAFVDRREEFHQSMLAATATLHRTVIATFMHDHSAAQLYNIIASQSAALSYADAFVVAGVIGFLMSPLAFALSTKKGPTYGQTSIPSRIATPAHGPAGTIAFADSAGSSRNGSARRHRSDREHGALLCADSAHGSRDMADVHRRTK